MQGGDARASAHAPSRGIPPPLARTRRTLGDSPLGSPPMGCAPAPAPPSTSTCATEPMSCGLPTCRRPWLSTWRPSSTHWRRLLKKATQHCAKARNLRRWGLAITQPCRGARKPEGVVRSTLRGSSLGRPPAGVRMLAGGSAAAAEGAPACWGDAATRTLEGASKPSRAPASMGCTRTGEDPVQGRGTGVLEGGRCYGRHGRAEGRSGGRQGRRWWV